MRPLVQKTPTKANENFENAVQPYLKDLKNYCRSLMKSTWDGEDLMQDTLEKAYKSWQEASGTVSKAYLFRIASNTWIDGYRKRKPDEALSQDLSGLTVEKTLDSYAFFEAIQLLLQELSPKQRVAMLLVDGFDYTAQETAERVGMSEGAVKAVLHRARRKLKRVSHQDDFYLDDDKEDDKVTTYATAFRDGKPEIVVDLFQKEMQQPQMSVASAATVSGPQLAVQQIVGVGASYVLVTLAMKNGTLLFIPFYRSEWLTLLSGLTEEFSFAA